MRRFVLALAILFGGLATVIVPAGIASATPVGPPIIQFPPPGAGPSYGSFSGTGVFDLSTPSCSSAPFHTVFNATYSTNTGIGSVSSGSVNLDGCAALPTSGTSAPYSGTARFTSSLGTVLTGQFGGTINISTGSLAVELLLPGTNGYTIVFLYGTWTSSGVPGVPGPVSGIIETQVSPPGLFPCLITEAVCPG